MHPNLVAIYGSPRKRGNTATLLEHAVAGARSAGGQVQEIHLRDLKLSPCFELYACKKSGQCAIQDDFQSVQEKLQQAEGILLASPIFFYTVSAHTKILMDRCQCQWVKKHWIDRIPFGSSESKHLGLFLSAGATHGKKLFEGVLLTVRYFFEVWDTQLHDSLLARGLNLEGDVFKHPTLLQEAHQKGVALVQAIEQRRSSGCPSENPPIPSNQSGL